MIGDEDATEYFYTQPACFCALCIYFEGEWDGMCVHSEDSSIVVAEAIVRTED